MGCVPTFAIVIAIPVNFTQNFEISHTIKIAHFQIQVDPKEIQCIIHIEWRHRSKENFSFRVRFRLL